MKKHLFLLCALLCTTLQLHAQEKWLAYTNKDFVKEIVIKGNNIWLTTDGGVIVRNITTGAYVAEYTKLDGLASNNTQSVVVDANQEVWVGTNGGVSRYNGTSWTSYTIANSGLVEDYVNTLAIDMLGNLWVGTNRGVSRYDGTTWTSYTTTNSGITSNNVRSIATDPIGNLWFGTSGGVSKYNGTTWTTYTTTNSSLAVNDVRSLATDEIGNLWVGTYNSGISKYNGTTWTTYTTANSGLAGNDVRSIATDAIGNLWFGTYGYGISKYDGTTWTTYNKTNSGLASNYVYSITTDSLGNIWFNTDVRVSKYNGMTWTSYTKANSDLVGNDVRVITTDTLGNLWVGADGGVSKYDGTTWTKYTTANSNLLLNSIGNTVDAIATDALGNIWFGTNQGLSKYDGTNWTSFTIINSGLAADNVRAIAIDVLGNIWVGTSKGVSKFDGTYWTSYTRENSGLAHNDIRAMTIDANGNIWAGTYSSGLSKFDGKYWRTYTRTNSGLANNYIEAIASDANGNIWVGTLFGLSKFDGTNWTTFNPENSSLTEEIVSAITPDVLGNIWVGTYGGVSKYDGTTWKSYIATNSGLADNYVRAITIDANGNIWVGTDGSGVMVLLNSTPKKIITGKVYLDKNQNQQKDANEDYLVGQKLQQMPDYVQAYTNSMGEYVFHADSGKNYTINYLTTNSYKLTKDTTYTVQINTDTILIPDFPVYRSDTTIYRSTISSLDRGRCNTEASVWLTYSNRGTSTDDVRVELTLDADLQVNGSYPAYDSIVGNILYYNFSPFKAGADRQIKLNIQNPTFQRMGDTLVFASKLTAGGLDFTTSAKTVITCSYDPNDKAVQPLPIGEENYTLKNEVLFYTVRFQNTGNDTAFYVAVKDTLDKSLDWNTFEVLGSSHTVNTTLDSSGVVTFEFADIVLPDSTTNEPASNGFVGYSIQAPKTVSENTIVKNTAHIYFDQNPAIVTNTTINNLVTIMPNDIIGFENDINISKSVFYPNPLRGSSIIKFDNKGTGATLQVQDVSGKIIFSKTSLSDEFELYRSEFKSTGLFIYTIQTANELVSGKLLVE